MDADVAWLLVGRVEAAVGELQRARDERLVVLEEFAASGSGAGVDRVVGAWSVEIDELDGLLRRLTAGVAAGRGLARRWEVEQESRQREVPADGGQVGGWQ